MNGVLRRRATLLLLTRLTAVAEMFRMSSRYVLQPQLLYSVHFETEAAVEVTSSLDKSYASLLPRDHALAHTHEHRTGSGDERDAAVWSGEHVAATEESA